MDRDTRRTERQRNRRDFWKGFLFTIAAIVPLFAFVFALRGGGTAIVPTQPDATEEGPTQAVVQPQEDVPLPATRSYNLLVMVYSDATDRRLLSTTLMRFDVESYRISLCSFPVTTVLLYNQMPSTLFEIYRQRGALGIRASLEQTLSIPISGYVSMTAEELAQLVDALGSFQYSLSQPLVVQGENGLTSYSKDAGTSRFTGNDVMQLLLHGNYSDSELQRQHEGLWQAALMQYANNTFSSKLESYYRAHVNALDTDISASGIYALCQTVATVCPEKGAQLEIVSLRGNHVGGVFELSESADSQLWVYFDRTAEPQSIAFGQSERPKRKSCSHHFSKNIAA